MRAIKALVIGMAVLLVAGLALLGYGVSTKVARKDDTSAAAPTASAGQADGAAPFGDVAVPLAPGAFVEETMVVSGRLALRVVEGDVGRIVVLDPVGGRVLGSFVLAPADGR